VECIVKYSGTATLINTRKRQSDENLSQYATVFTTIGHMLAALKLTRV